MHNGGANRRPRFFVPKRHTSPAMNNHAVHQPDRGAWIASKLRSYGGAWFFASRPDTRAFL